MILIFEISEAPLIKTSSVTGLILFSKGSNSICFFLNSSGSASSGASIKWLTLPCFNILGG